jgi:hypothetical protein
MHHQQWLTGSEFFVVQLAPVDVDDAHRRLVSRGRLRETVVAR